MNVRDSRGGCGFPCASEAGGTTGELDVYRRTIACVSGSLNNEVVLTVRAEDGMRMAVNRRASNDIEKILMETFPRFFSKSNKKK